MKRYGRALLLFALGVVVGLLVSNRQPRRQPARGELKQPISVRREGEKAIYLVPYSLCLDGRAEVVGEKGAGAMWVIHLDGARVQVAATEEADPR